MKRVLHGELMRSHLTNRAAIVLLIGLLLVLVLAMAQGVRTLLS